MNLISICNSSARAMDTFFWNSWAPALTCTHNQHTDMYTFFPLIRVRMSPWDHIFECLVCPLWNCLRSVALLGDVTHPCQGFKIPCYFQLILPCFLSLPYACESDISPQLLLQHHVFLPAAMFSALMAMTLTFCNSDPLSLLLFFISCLHGVFFFIMETEK